MSGYRNLGSFATQATGAPAPAALEMPQGTDGSPPPPHQRGAKPRGHRPKKTLTNLSVEQTVLVTVAATMIAAVVVILIEPELSQMAMVGYFSGVLVVDAAGWVLAYQRLISPLRAMAESCGDKTTLAQALDEVRADFLEELHDAVLEADKAVESHSGPAGAGRAMSEETLRAVTTLVDAAGIAKDLIQGMPEARLELDNMVIALTAGIPAAIALSVPIAAARLPASAALPIFLGTAVIAAVLLMVADLFGNERPPGWTRRVLLLRGLPVGAVSEKLRSWAESGA